MVRRDPQTSGDLQQHQQEARSRAEGVALLEGVRRAAWGQRRRSGFLAVGTTQLGRSRDLASPWRRSGGGGWGGGSCMPCLSLLCFWDTRLHLSCPQLPHLLQSAWSARIRGRPLWPRSVAAQAGGGDSCILACTVLQRRCFRVCKCHRSGFVTLALELELILCQYALTPYASGGEVLGCMKMHTCSSLWPSSPT